MCTNWSICTAAMNNAQAWFLVIKYIRPTVHFAYRNVCGIKVLFPAFIHVTVSFTVADQQQSQPGFCQKIVGRWNWASCKKMFTFVSHISRTFLGEGLIRVCHIGFKKRPCLQKTILNDQVKYDESHFVSKCMRVHAWELWVGGFRWIDDSIGSARTSDVVFRRTLWAPDRVDCAYWFCHWILHWLLHQFCAYWFCHWILHWLLHQFCAYWICHWILHWLLHQFCAHRSHSFLVSVFELPIDHSDLLNAPWRSQEVGGTRRILAQGNRSTSFEICGSTSPHLPHLSLTWLQTDVWKSKNIMFA